ncbi:50S ribosomal protein L25 [Patescibacteria group bacterium]|nr:50S ribosomal protein L25 [Patescibacteria group bacterium]MBU1970208.1 50S ribosomal protein L25 [Patescibacteria group bacterium]
MQIDAQSRQTFGKKNKTLRAQRRLPGVVMEKGQASTPLSLDLVQFTKVYKEAGETSLIDLRVADAKDKGYKVLVSEVQLHPVSMNPLHVVFRKIDLKEKLVAQVPVKVINEELNPLVKAGEAIVLKLLDEIPVEALPADLPKEFVIDAIRLVKIGDEVTIADLEYDRKKVEISEYEADEAVAKLDEMQEMQAEEETVVSEEEAVAQVTATEELSDEEKAKKEAQKTEGEPSEKK